MQSQIHLVCTGIHPLDFLQRTVSENDVGHRQKALAEAHVSSSFYRDVALALDSNGDHGYYHRNKNAQECCILISKMLFKDAALELLCPRALLTSYRHPIDLIHCTRQGAQEADDQSNDTKYQGTCAVVRQHIHQDAKH